MKEFPIKHRDPVLFRDLYSEKWLPGFFNKVKGKEDYINFPFLSMEEISYSQVAPMVWEHVGSKDDTFDMIIAEDLKDYR